MMKKVGFIGLGLMGKPMALNLVRAGYEVTVHNRSQGAMEVLVEAGAKWAGSPQEVAEVSEVVISCVPDGPDVEKVVLGEAGVLAGASEGLIYIDMSTISPAFTQKLAAELGERGVKMLDAPISGGDVGAQKGTLTIMVGGEEAVFEQCLPIFEVMGSRITYIGPSGAGQTAKACNQVIVAGTMAVMAEALVLAQKSGVDPARVVAAISGGAARCWALEVRAPQILRRDLEPGFKAYMQYKDLHIVGDAGRAVGAPLPVTGVVRELYTAMMAAGRGELDNSAVVTVLEDLARVEVGS
ncbi:MAG TPA: NAD(P)-binding domain-containing protein [Anaerolineae bacterium]|nr:NAD(P)-binding domain-containing protein [Anaerolineae bacterium]